MTAREVVLDGGSPWGFRMNGGADAGHALKISRVNPGSKASQKGIREGDVITSINGQPTKCLTNGDSHALLRNVGNTLKLGLNEDTNGSPKRKNKDSAKRDTAGSSTQSLNSSPAAAPSSVAEVAADTSAATSSNSKGKKSRNRQNQEQNELNKSRSVQEVRDLTQTNNALEQEVSKPFGMSSSRARRLRKARLNNKRKGEQGTAAEEQRQCDVTDVSEAADLAVSENSDFVASGGDLVDILVVVDADDVEQLDSDVIDTELCDMLKAECDSVNDWLDRSGEKSLNTEASDSLSLAKDEEERAGVKITELNTDESRTTQEQTQVIESVSEETLNGKSTQLNLKPSTDSQSSCTKRISEKRIVESKVVKEIVLPEKEDVILPDNAERVSSTTEQKKAHSISVFDCMLCKEKRSNGDGKKVSFADDDSTERNGKTLSSDTSQDKRLTCKMSDLPKQQSVVIKETATVEPCDVVLLSPVPVDAVCDAPRLSWGSVSDAESTSSQNQLSSSDDEIHSDMLKFLPPNEVSSAKVNAESDCNSQLGEYNLSVQDIRDPLIKPEEEKQLRQFLKTLELTKPEEFDDSSSTKSMEESSVTSGSETDSKEEVVVYKHVRSRCVPETCYIPADRRRHLEVITEEGSDPSDTERIPDFSRPWENSEIIRKNNEIQSIPNDWFGSDEDNITSDEGGIDTSWGNGTKLEDLDGIEVIYLGENSEDDEEIMRQTFREPRSRRNNSLAQPELVVVRVVDINAVTDTSDEINVFDINSEIEEKKNKVQEIINILDNTYEINKEEFSKCNVEEKTPVNDVTQESETITCGYNKNDKLLNDSRAIVNESLGNDAVSLFCTFDDRKYIESRGSPKDGVDINGCPMPQEKLDAITSPPTLSRQGSTSSGTGSQSTAKYYPGQSPMSSESEDKTENDGCDSTLDRRKNVHRNPKSLQSLAENVVVSLPNGGYFLEQIGFYSQDNPFQLKQEGLKLSSLPPSGISTRRSSSNQELENINLQPLHSPPRSIVMVSSPPGSDLPASPPLEEHRWVGMPTSVDPRVLVCLSPSQSKSKAMPTPAEASGLLDLHKKFMERRGYHEQFKRNAFSPKNDKPMTPAFTNSPDLLRLDPLDSDKSGLYTPELLTEAANLLALQQYRNSRFRLDNGIELNSDVPTKYELDREGHGGTSCESDFDGEEKWQELEAIRSGESEDSKPVIKKSLLTSCTTASEIKYNLEKTAEFFKTLNESKTGLRGNNVHEDTFIKCDENNSKGCLESNVINQCNKQKNINVSDNVIKGAGVCTPMTSSDTEINRHFEDADVNRSTGSSTSRLLAIIQRTDAPGFSGLNELRNNTVPSDMNCDENSAEKSRTFVGNRSFVGNNFISNWLTMSQNVGSDSESNLKNGNVLSKLQFIDSDIDNSDCKVNDTYCRQFEADKYKISKQGDIAVMQASDADVQKLRRERPRSLPPIHATGPTGGEVFRQKMYNEYMDKVAERSERRQHKVIKISNRPASMYSRVCEADTAFVDCHKLENEFMGRVKDRMNKLGIPIDDDSEQDEPQEESRIPEDVHVRLGSEEATVSSLPKHLQEFLELTLAPPTETQETTTGVWSPVGTPEAQRKEFNFKDVQKEESEKKPESSDEPVPAVWTPKSANASPTLEKKAFRPVNFESPKATRKVYTSQNSQEEPKPPTDLPVTLEWKKAYGTTTTTHATVEHEQQLQSTSSRIVSSQSAPDTSIAGTDSKLPRAQNPTITLLQKAREGQLPRGAHYLEPDTVVRDQDNKSPTVYPNEIIYSIRKEYESETEDKKPKKIVELGPRKFEGIGPTTKEGIPIVLRSEVKDVNQQKWYKRMYDSLHKAERDKDSVTVRYKTRKGHYPYTSSAGYLSEPEHVGRGYDSDYISSKYATLDRRRIRNKENDFTTNTMPREKGYGNAVKHAVDVYKNQPGRIEDYEPGSSSIADKETKQWWDEVMDIFDGQFEQTQKGSSRPQNIPTTRSTKPYMTYALKESGYESDSTLVFKRRDEQQQQQLSPAEQKNIYKTIQKGGEVPLHGLRKPAPERPKEPIMGRHIPATQRDSYPKDRQKESPHRYVESEVTIHYRSPVRSEEKEAWSEEELQRRQAEAMRRIYQEERRRKYLQELQDMYSRRHTDNFTPSQKSPIPLNRYDDFLDDLSPTKPRDRTPEPKLVARALYNFIGQTSRELSFRRGDIIYVRRQIDKNWYEGEHNAMVGLFPFNYVEIIPYDGIRTVPKKASEGQARAKFNFQAQTHLELPLVKGELVLLTRRVDENWYEGRIGNRKGIFPVSYVDILVEPGERTMSPVRISPSNVKPVASPASHSLHVSNNMSQHHYQPPRPVSYTSLPRAKIIKPDPPPVNQTLHIDTQNEPVPYRVLYNYKPQNEDELELTEGETVYVMEKCDDGWYVGSSQRTGYLGTFPGNYVERIV